jgi:hypothetical protein
MIRDSGRRLIWAAGHPAVVFRQSDPEIEVCEMENTRKKPNVFVVGTPFQLLNAIEAAKSLALSNNHLVVVECPGLDRTAFAPLIAMGEWNGVTFVPLELPGGTNIPGRPGRAISRRWHRWYLHFKRRQGFARICRSFGQANMLFLGHDCVEYAPFMRHFANSLKHEQLCLLDDGTDVIAINNRRKGTGCSSGQSLELRKASGDSMVSKMKAYLRRKFWDWNLEEAESMTFFTNYALQVRPGDHLIKNDFRYLRSLAVHSVVSDEVCFLGQSFVEDNFMRERTYLEHLRKAGACFERDRVVYVPHPRESERTVASIAGSLGFEIRRFGVPIEVAIVAKGYLPRVLASFFCSALESCSNILGENVKIACFRIAADQMLNGREEAMAIYEYFSNKASRNFVIIPLQIGDPCVEGPC